VRSRKYQSIFSAMEQLRLSPSRLNDFSNCPLLYKYRTIDKLPESPSLDAERGTLVHTVLHDLFESPAELRTVHTAVDLLPSRWRDQLESKPELAVLISNEKEWIDRAAALLETYFVLENPTNFEPTHREFHLEQNLQKNIYLHGYVDRLDVAPSGEVRIVDYKTGKSPKPGWEEKALFQLRVYALLYWKEHNVIPKLLQLIYLGSASTLKNSPSEQDLINTEKTLLRIAESIQKAMDTDTWLAKKSKLCDWCSFKSICPAHN
jgi:putative RecB family exonuclease